MTNPMSQASVPAAAAAAADATHAEEGVDEAAQNSEGVPVGEADLEADAQRAEEDKESDR